MPTYIIYSDPYVNGYMYWYYDGTVNETRITGNSQPRTTYSVGGSRSDGTIGSGKSTFTYKFLYDYQSFLQFNLPSFLPYTEQVTSASLSMYVTTSYNNSGSGTISAKKYNWISASVGVSDRLITSGQLAPNASSYAAWQTSASPTYATLNYPSSVSAGRYNFVTSGSSLVSDINTRTTIKIALVNNADLSSSYEWPTDSSNQINFAEDVVKPSLKPQLVLTTTVSSGFKNFKVASNFPYITSSYVDILSYAAINGNLDVTGNINSIGTISSPSIQFNVLSQTLNGTATFSGSTINFNNSGGSVTFTGKTYFNQPIKINTTSMTIENLTINSNYTGINIVGNSTTQILANNSTINIGSNNTAGYTNGIVIGISAQGSTNTISIGRNAFVGSSTGHTNIAIGYNAQYSVSSNYGIGIGYYATGGGISSVAIGYAPNTNNYNYSVAIGNSTSTQGTSTVAIGNSSQAISTGTIAIGNQTNATNIYAVAIGQYAQATAAGAVAIGTDSGGNGAYSPNTNQIVLGTASHTTYISGSLNVGIITNASAALTVPVTTGRISSINGCAASAVTSSSITSSGITPTGFRTFNLIAGRLYQYKIIIFYQSATSAMAVKSYLTYPTLTFGTAMVVATSQNNFYSNATTSSLTSTSATLTPTVGGAISTTSSNLIEGILFPSANGTFSYQCGPSTAGTASFSIGSFMIMSEIG